MSSYCIKFIKKKNGKIREIGKTKGGLNSKLHIVCNNSSKPIALLLTAGNISDFTGADKLIPMLPNNINILLGDKGYDSDSLRDKLELKDIKSCIPYRKNRKKKIKHKLDRC